MLTSSTVFGLRTTLVSPAYLPLLYVQIADRPVSEVFLHESSEQLLRRIDETYIQSSLKGTSSSALVVLAPSTVLITPEVISLNAAISSLVIFLNFSERGGSSFAYLAGVVDKHLDELAAICSVLREAMPAERTACRRCRGSAARLALCRTAV